MIELFQIEWLKLKKYRTFWVFLLILILSFPSVVSLAYYFQTQFPKRGRVLFDPITFFQFPYIWQTTAWLSGFLMILPVLLVITLITNEYSYRTHRQNIIDGWSRQQFISAKWLWMAIFALCSTVVVFLTSLVFGMICGKQLSVTSWTQGIEFAGYFFLEISDYLAFAFLAGILIKRAGLALGFYFLYAWIIEKIIWVILNKYLNPLGHFLPLMVTDYLIPNPFLQRIPGVAPDNTSPLVYAGFTVGYTLIFLGLSRRYFLRSDL